MVTRKRRENSAFAKIRRRQPRTTLVETNKIMTQRKKTECACQLGGASILMRRGINCSP